MRRWGSSSDGEVEWRGDPHRYSFFSDVYLPRPSKEIKVGQLRVRVEQFVPNLLICYNCNRFGHTSAGCKTTAKCVRSAKEKRDLECDGPPKCSNRSGPHAFSAKDCPVRQMEKEMNASALRNASLYQKPGSWWRQRLRPSVHDIVFHCC